MGFFDLLMSPFRGGSTQHAPGASNESVMSERQWSGLSFGGASSSAAGIRVDETAALSLPATLQALRILTGVFAMTPMPLFRVTGSGRERARDEDLYRLMHDKPNNYQSAFAFRELMMADLMLWGNFYAYVSRDFAGRPVALTRLKPGTVLVAEFFDRRDGYTMFYDATLPDDTRERFPSRDIWHVANFTRDGLVGLNPIAFARDALGGAIQTSRHASKYWGQGGRPPVALKVKTRVDADDKARIRSDWNSKFGGPNGDNVAVLDQDMDVSFLTEDNVKSQFLETRQFQVVDLARLWGVPPHLIFDLSRSTNNNIEHQSLEFVIYHLGPHYERIAQSATIQFAPEGHYFEHVTDALVKGDIKSRMEAYWLQRQMGMANANELRRRENEPNIEGAAGEEYWRPGNMTLAGTPVEPPSAPQTRIEP
jgi:HK97 family phage portal protein